MTYLGDTNVRGDGPTQMKDPALALVEGTKEEAPPTPANLTDANQVRMMVFRRTLCYVAYLRHTKGLQGERSAPSVKEPS